MSRDTRQPDTTRHATSPASAATDSTRARRPALSAPDLAGATIILAALIVALLHT